MIHPSVIAQPASLVAALGVLTAATVLLPPSRRRAGLRLWIGAAACLVLFGGLWASAASEGLLRRPGYGAIATGLLLIMVLRTRSLDALQPAALGGAALLAMAQVAFSVGIHVGPDAGAGRAIAADPTYWLIIGALFGLTSFVLANAGRSADIPLNGLALAAALLIASPVLPGGPEAFDRFHVEAALVMSLFACSLFTAFASSAGRTRSTAGAWTLAAAALTTSALAPWAVIELSRSTIS